MKINWRHSVCFVKTQVIWIQLDLDWGHLFLFYCSCSRLLFMCFPVGKHADLNKTQKGRWLRSGCHNTQYGEMAPICLNLSSFPFSPYTFSTAFSSIFFCCAFFYLSIYLFHNSAVLWRLSSIEFKCVVVWFCKKMMWSQMQKHTGGRQDKVQMASVIIQKTTKCKMPKYNVPTKSKVQIRKNTKPETLENSGAGSGGSQVIDTGGLHGKNWQQQHGAHTFKYKQN